MAYDDDDAKKRPGDDPEGTVSPDAVDELIEETDEDEDLVDTADEEKDEY